MVGGNRRTDVERVPRSCRNRIQRIGERSLSPGGIGLRSNRSLRTLHRVRLPQLVLVSAALLSCPLFVQAAADSAVKLTRSDDRVRVEIDGQLFTEYIFKGASRPY